MNEDKEQTYKSSRQTTVQNVKIISEKLNQVTNEDLEEDYKISKALAVATNCVLKIEKNTKITEDDMERVAIIYLPIPRQIKDTGFLNYKLVEGVINQTIGDKVELILANNHLFQVPHNPEGVPAKKVKYSGILKSFFQDCKQNAQLRNFVLFFNQIVGEQFKISDRGKYTLCFNEDSELVLEGVVNQVYSKNKKVEITDPIGTLHSFDLKDEAPLRTQKKYSDISYLLK